MPDYQAFRVETIGHVAHVQIARPDHANAMNAAFWRELVEIFQWIDESDAIRVVVLSGAGRHFSAGMDLALLADIGSGLGENVGRNAQTLRRKILALQAAVTAVEACCKPVLAAIHGACLGAAVDLIAACDMRYAAADLQLAIKEIDLGMVADLGTLQRLPQLINAGLLRELAYTGRSLGAEEACRIGLVNRVYTDSAALLDGVLEIAAQIAAKSPLAIRGSKRMLSYMRDHRVADGLEYVATWNAAMLQSTDVRHAMLAQMTKQNTEFAD